MLLETLIHRGVGVSGGGRMIAIGLNGGDEVRTMRLVLLLHVDFKRGQNAATRGKCIGWALPNSRVSVALLRISFILDDCEAL